MTTQVIVESDRVITNGTVNFKVSTIEDGIIGYFSLYTSYDIQERANTIALNYYEAFFKISKECRVAVDE